MIQMHTKDFTKVALKHHVNLQRQLFCEKEEDWNQDTVYNLSVYDGQQDFLTKVAEKMQPIVVEHPMLTKRTSSSSSLTDSPRRKVHSNHININGEVTGDSSHLRKPFVLILHQIIRF